MAELNKEVERKITKIANSNIENNATNPESAVLTNNFGFTLLNSSFLYLFFDIRIPQQLKRYKLLQI